MRLPRTIRLDASDTQVFERPAEPGEWAVSGAFAFLREDPGTLSGKQRQAFANGFLGTASFGWSSLVVVSDAEEGDAETVAQALARHFVAAYGAPSVEAALPVAREEVAFAAGLCEHPVNTLLAVTRTVDADGGIRESFRVIQAPGRPQHARIWAIEPDPPDSGEDEPTTRTGGG